ncbi:hypothetical protein LB559_09225 [Mesorhizobium sp. BR1-1-3]|uniref:hypothetical protein n=1 Tax=Mesorhizobium sp. BR1-1-3 TaxID=2876651 RepID=UPI001CD0A236|nr:hypothetical protein [Mesorhizobium sp. BR1-1-3]MBZ9888119.1 hypothetical protein [Mesorhizobium sp. BR1-1-3]
MKIKLLVSLAGAFAAFNVGDECEWDNEDAIRLIEAGFAVPSAETKIERAVAMPAAEKRGKRSGDDVASADSNDSGN